MQNNIERSLANSIKKYEEISEDVSLTQEDLRKNLKGGPKPSIEKFRENIDETIDKVLEEQNSNLWLSVLKNEKSNVREELEKVCNNFFAESLRSGDDTLIFDDREKLKEIVEYLLYQQENIRNLIKKDKDSTRLSAYNNYEFIDKFLRDDEFLAKELDMSVADVKSIFTQGQKNHFLVNNISIMEALHKVKDNVEKVLTDENIAQELDMEVSEVKEIFTKSRKIRLAISNPSLPMEALGKVKHHLEVTLTDENIAQELDMEVSEVKEIFTKSRKIRLAISNPSLPMETLGKIKHHLEVTLTDENIAKELGVPINEVVGLFSDGVKNTLAEKYISQPIKGIALVILGKIQVTLPPKNPSKELKAKASAYLEINK